MTQFPELESDKVYQAIKEGVYEAIRGMMEGAYTAPANNILDSIEEGTKQAIIELKK